MKEKDQKQVREHDRHHNEDNEWKVRCSDKEKSSWEQILIK